MIWMIFMFVNFKSILVKLSLIDITESYGWWVNIASAKWHAITWANIEPVVYSHIASLGTNDFIQFEIKDIQIHTYRLVDHD